MALFLVEYDILSTNKDVIEARNAVHDNLKNHKATKYYFRVSGENKMVAVIQGDPDDITDTVMKSGHDINVHCTSLIDYASFAKNTLGFPEFADELAGETVKFTKPHIFWMKINVEYMGQAQKDLLATVLDEAKFVFGAKQAGVMQMAMFKATAQRQVHHFLAFDSPDELDAGSWGLPIMLQLGNQVHIQATHLTKLD